MKNFLKLIFFVIYTITIFLINNLIVLTCLFFVNNIIAIFLKIDFKDMIRNFKLLLPFILFTIIINIFFDSVLTGFLIGIRIIICYNITYIFSKTITILEIADTIQKLFSPLKLFKINTNNIMIIVSISLCMIPILKDEIEGIIYSMKSKGKLVKISSIRFLMKPLLISILRRTAQMEKALIAKGYIE